MSTLMLDDKLLETRGNEEKGWIIEIMENGSERDLGYEYSCYAEAEEALISLIYKKQEPEH